MFLVRITWFYMWFSQHRTTWSPDRKTYWKILSRLFLRNGAQLRAPLKPFDTIVLGCYRGFQEI